MISKLIQYKGASVQIDAGSPPSVALRINGILRASESSGSNSCTLRISSSVQTDYEWHEYVDVTATFQNDEVNIELSANNFELLNESFKL